MLPTEIQRIILIIGLAATAYLMMLAWNEDYGRPAEPRRTEAPALATLPADPPMDIPRQESGASDVPDESLLGPVGTQESSSIALDTPSAQVTEGRLVRVVTNDLQLWIDRLGGDIVRVQLPGFPVSLDRPDVPFVLLDSGNGRTYVAQSGLIGPDGTDTGGRRPLFDVGALEFDFRTSGGSVELHTRVGAVDVSKVFTFQSDGHLVTMEYRIDNRGSEPFTVGMFAQLKRDGEAVEEGGGGFGLGPRPYLGAALTTGEERYLKLGFDDLDDEDFRETVEGGWIAILQHYFLSAWVADAASSNRYYGQRRDDGTYIVGYTSPVQRVEPGQLATFHTAFYAGPKDQRTLEKISPNLNLTIDYGFLWWIAVPLFYLLDWWHGFVGNWGVAIILLTLVVKTALYPLSAASYRSMAKMRKVAPQMKRLQERYSDDRQKLSQEMMSLYKKEKANPLGGCLPILVQMPVFIALYWVLFESVELRQAPFLLWIDDLSAMDPFFVLPILMGASMFFQQTLNPPMPDPMQARIMKMMPIMFTVLFLFFPAGLVLYWLVNNVLSMTQQWLITRQIERGSAPAKS
ncbi:MAG: membrane protein insertase YidC [Gammaproteobacteria bacterium]|nr:MAG: membrane protein insertase YidC [Gammaproteobacteria bacterium]